MAYSIHAYSTNNVIVVSLYDNVDDTQVSQTLKIITKYCEQKNNGYLIMYDATRISELVVGLDGLDSIAEHRNNLTRSGYAVKAASAAQRPTDLEIARLLEHYKALPETVHRAFSSLKKAWAHLGVEPPEEDEPFQDLTNLLTDDAD